METKVINPSIEAQLFKRVSWRLVPLLVAIYLVAYIDRANIGFAKLQMLSSLKMNETSYGFASSLFFIGYLIFEVPSNLAMHRYGARRWRRSRSHGHRRRSHSRSCASFSARPKRGFIRASFCIWACGFPSGSARALWAC
jgi:hypothetical protein